MNEDNLIASGIVIAIIVVIGFFFAPFTIVGAGQRGVVMNFGKVQDDVLGEGLHWRTPIVQSVKKISVRVQKNDVQAEAASKDLQVVNTSIVVNYHIDSSKVNRVYQNVGDNDDVFERIISPNTNEVVKASTAKFTAEELLIKRDILKTTIDRSLAERLKSYDVILDDVSIVNIDFSKDFNRAIELKAAAVQNAQKAENDLRRIEIEAKQTIESAKAQAESIKIQSEALQQNQNLVEWEAVKKWNGVLPQYQLGGATPFINIPSR